MKLKKRQNGHRLTLLLVPIAALLLASTLLGCSASQNNLQPSQTPELPSTSENAEVATYEEKTATIVSAGDLLMHSPILNSCYAKASNSYDFDEIFAYLKPYISEYDYAVANLECSISEPAWGYSSYPLFRIPASIIDSAKNVGFDLLLTANNHSNDGGTRGILNTMSALSQRSMSFTGSKTDENLSNYVVADVNGIKVGMVNYTYGEILDGNISSLNGNRLSTTTSRLVNVFDYKKLDAFYSEISAVISDMKNDGADITMLYIHWGDEYQTRPNALQKEIANHMCALGFDVIVGGHPHVIQPLELLEHEGHKTVCLYSTGNLISNQRIERMNLKTGHTEDGILFGVKISKTGAKARVSGISVLPTWVRLYNSNGAKKYKIIPIDKNQDLAQEYDLGEDLAKVNKSYDRTMALVQEGLSAAAALQ